MNLLDERVEARQSVACSVIRTQQYASAVAFQALFPQDPQLAIPGRFPALQLPTSIHLQGGANVRVWTNAFVIKDLRGDPRQRAAHDLLIQGSSTLYSPLLAAGLIDELVLMTFSIVPGTGKRLFGDCTPPGALRLLNQQIGTNGVIVTRWTPAGPIPMSNHPHPSAAEAERQHQMKEGTW